MRPHLFLIASIALTAATAFAQDPSNETSIAKAVEPLAGTSESNTQATAYAQELYGTGESMHNFGRVLGWGSIALYVASGATNNPNLAVAGLLSLLVGIPVNGSGANDMVDAANALNPSAAVEMNGWGTYGASWAMMGGGVAMIFGSAAHNNTSLAVPAVLCVMGGGILQYVSWFRFSNSADHAALAMGAMAYSVDIMPAVYPSRKNGAIPGARVALQF